MRRNNSKETDSNLKMNDEEEEINNRKHSTNMATGTENPNDNCVK